MFVVGTFTVLFLISRDVLASMSLGEPFLVEQDQYRRYVLRLFDEFLIGMIVVLGVPLIVLVSPVSLLVRRFTVALENRSLRFKIDHELANKERIRFIRSNKVLNRILLVGMTLSLISSLTIVSTRTLDTWNVIAIVLPLATSIFVAVAYAQHQTWSFFNEIDTPRFRAARKRWILRQSISGMSFAGYGLIGISIVKVITEVVIPRLHTRLFLDRFADAASHLEGRSLSDDGERILKLLNDYGSDFEQYVSTWSTVVNYADWIVAGLAIVIFAGRVVVPLSVADKNAAQTKYFLALFASAIAIVALQATGFFAVPTLTAIGIVVGYAAGVILIPAK